MLEQYPDILSIKEFCRILQISRKTAYRLLQENSGIRYRRIGRSYRISKESLIRYMNPCTSQEKQQEHLFGIQ